MVTAQIELKACPRCRGAVEKDVYFHDLHCLQCGWRIYPEIPAETSLYAQRRKPQGYLLRYTGSAPANAPVRDLVVQMVPVQGRQHEPSVYGFVPKCPFCSAQMGLPVKIDATNRVHQRVLSFKCDRAGHRIHLPPDTSGGFRGWS